MSMQRERVSLRLDGKVSLSTASLNYAYVGIYVSKRQIINAPEFLARSVEGPDGEAYRHPKITRLSQKKHDTSQGKVGHLV